MPQLVPTHVGVLIAACVSMWAVNCVYDLPSSLSEPLRSHLSLSEPRFAYLISLLFTVYSAPNMVLPFFSGPLTLHFGERQVWRMTAACLVLGQVICAFGIQTRQVWMLVLGRVVVGLGGEIIGVLSYDVVTRWYSDKRLSLALAMALGVPRLGAVANAAVLPALVQRYGVPAATWAFGLVPLSLTVLSALYMAPLLGEAAADPGSPFAAGASLAYVRHLSRAYWKLACICVTGYACMNSFGNSAQRFLAAWYFGGDQVAAGKSLSFSYFIAAAFVPFTGVILEMPWFSIPGCLMLSSGVMGVSHLALYLHVFGAVVPLFSLGTANALFGTAYWAGVARTLLVATRTSKPPSSPATPTDQSPLLFGSEELYQQPPIITAPTTMKTPSLTT
ncbi:hypothetical protein PG988_011968 [Apiospora saccharicola]